MSYIKPVTFWLTIIGALNWGLIGLLKINLVTMLFSSDSFMTTIIYLAIGASAVYVAMGASSKKKK